PAQECRPTPGILTARQRVGRRRGGGVATATQDGEALSAVCCTIRSTCAPVVGACRSRRRAESHDDAAGTAPALPERLHKGGAQGLGSAAPGPLTFGPKEPPRRSNPIDVTAAFASRAPGGHLAMTARAARTGVAGHRHVRRSLAAPSRGLRGPAA